ncbi:MAG: biosynthetic-type acetolactate synthase large subunit [Spirochaetaceae bacterium]|nr:biosynthetic-type acetolactate synthase large subunit [Spirochaetaceae bacterium]
MIEATGSQIIVKLLEQQGITMAAGIPGGSVLPLYDELTRSNIKHILVRHEQAAGFIAQGIARTTGLPAVCIATSGPGAMNLLTAIADARSDSIPMVAITGQVNSYLIGTDAFQEADTFGLSFPITKHSIMVKSPIELLEAIPHAFSIAASGRPGPVLIDIPRDVQMAKCSFEKWPESGKLQKKATRFKTEGESFAKAITAFSNILAKANRPVLYAGGGCNSPEAAKGIFDFLEILPMPVVSSLMGIGCIPESDYRWAGMVGMHGSATANRAMYDADVVLAAGVRFDDRATGIVSKFCPNATILHIDIDAAEVNKILPAEYSIIADCESVFPVLAEKIREEYKSGIQTKPWVEHIHKMYKEEQENIFKQNKNDSLPDPRSFIAKIPELAKKSGIQPEDIIVTTDVGQHQMWTAQFYPIEKPRQLLTSGSLGTMGFGLPAAIGAALANPQKRIVCFSGDGSIMMNIQELATLSEQNLDVTVIVLENGSLGMVRQQQEFLFDKNYSACLFEKQPDLISIAKGFGIDAFDTVEDSEWYKKAFPKNGCGPRFVRCRIAQAENVYPFVPAGKANIEAITGN